MRKLALALALAGISQAAGCIFTSDGDGDDGRFGVSWTFTINGAAPNDPQDACDLLGAAWFSNLSTDSAGNGTDDQFPCADLSGTTGPLLAPDTYTIEQNLLDAAKVKLPDVPAVGPFTVDLPSGEVVDLDTPNYEIQSLALVDLFVDYGVAGGSNCDSTVDGGSGVVQQQIFISDAVACLDFLVITGTDQTGAAFSTDACGDPELCMETTVAQQFDIAPGSYTIEVLGLKSATDGLFHVCYQTSGPMNITGASATVQVVAPFDPDPIDDIPCNETKPGPH